MIIDLTFSISGAIEYVNMHYSFPIKMEFVIKLYKNQILFLGI